jgi:ubiquinone/menaquinone biosynthesis C-methylase UbiE
VDLGCGTGASGAAWALHAARNGRPAPALTGYDRHSWAVEEARWTYRALGIRGRVNRGDLTRIRFPRDDSGIILAYTVNELDDAARAALLAAVLRSASRGGRVLVVEPISRRLTPWWNTWAKSFRSAGGRADDWRFDVKLPEILRRLDRAAGLDHSKLTARTLWVSP